MFLVGEHNHQVCVPQISISAQGETQTSFREENFLRQVETQIAEFMVPSNLNLNQ